MMVENIFPKRIVNLAGTGDLTILMYRWQWIVYNFVHIRHIICLWFIIYVDVYTFLNFNDFRTFLKIVSNTSIFSAVILTKYILVLIFFCSQRCVFFWSN